MFAAGSPWPRLRGLPAYRITEIPRWDSGVSPADTPRREGTDPGRGQRAAALAAAFHAGSGTIAFGWVREAAGGPVHLIAAGETLAGSRANRGCGAFLAGSRADSADVLLSLPGGARATPLAPEALAGLLAGLPRWREIAGICDCLLVPAGSTPPRQVTRSLEEGMLGSWTDPFGWLVLADPLPVPDLRTLADDTARRLHLAETAADRFPEQAVEARRLRERHAELRRGISAGFWCIRVAAGGCDAASAARIAGLFCASADLAGLPYALSPALAAESDPDGGSATPAVPFRGSTELLAALARPPESEVPGVRLTLRPDFDVTPEEPAAGESLRLGDTLDRGILPAGEFRIRLDSLNRHVFVCGATGAGKSQTVRSLLESAAGLGIGWLVIEPAKAEYRLMANRLQDAEIVRIRPGEADAIAAGLNPLEPAVAGQARFPLQTHSDLVRALFIASFRAEEPFPQVLSAALTRVYEEAGWDLALGEPAGREAACPTLTDLERAAERVVTEIGYSQRVTDDVLGFVRVRIASLRTGTTGRFLEGGHPIDFGSLLGRNVVLELEDVGDDRDKAFLMGAVLIRLAEHLRLGGGASLLGSPPLRHLTVVEEAHRLLRRAEPGAGAGSGAGADAVEMFAGLLAEVRAYGEGLVVADQIPARLIPDVIKNTAVKIVHRLPAADDRDAVGATMNVTPPQSRYLVTLPPGRAAAFADGMDFPVLVHVSDGTPRERAAPPVTRDAAPVVTPRSGTCGATCHARPCTLREMRGAQRALDDCGWLRGWAELAVLAHLTGWPMPVPEPALLAELRALSPRLGQCAVSHAVDAAVASRVPVLAGQMSPAGLAGHACAAIRARAERGAWLCGPDEPEWRLAGRVTEAAVFGVTRPSAIERAACGNSAAYGFPERITALLGRFIDCRWPLPYLIGSSSGDTAANALDGHRTPQ